MNKTIRIISFLLAVCTVLIAASGCFGGSDDTTENPFDHTCEMVWQYDPYNHWKACTYSGCTETSDYGAHTFANSSSSVEGDTLTYTSVCTVCQYQYTEKGATEVVLTMEDVVTAYYDGAITFAHIDMAYDEGAKYHYFQQLKKKGANTVTVRANEDTTVTFVIVGRSGDGSRGLYSSVFRNLTVNGSSEGVTYTKGYPTFKGWGTPIDAKVATIQLKAGLNVISYEINADVGVSGYKFTGLTSPIKVTAKAEDVPMQMLEGAGTKESPWLISSAADFVTMDRLIKDDPSFADDYYKMTADVDFKGVEFAGINSSVEFSGTFDGDGHVVRNLKIERTLKSYQGFFSKVVNGTIKNFGIESGTIVGHSYVGGIAGYAKSSSFTNCFNEASVQGFNEIGGIIGQATTATISNSFNKGSLRISGKEMIGGLVGNATGAKIVNSYNLGWVAYGSRSGQIIGHANNCKFENVYYDKDSGADNQPVGSLQSFKGLVAMTREELIAESFVETLNANLKDGYIRWSYGEDKAARLSTFVENNKISIFAASIDSVTIKDKKVQPLISKDGAYKTVVYGSDKQSVIGLDGSVYEPLVPQKVLLILDIVEIATGEVVARVDRNIEVTVSGRHLEGGINTCPNVVPGLREWYGLSGNFTVTENTRIVAATEDLTELATRVQTYLEEMVGIKLTVVEGGAKDGDIVLQYNKNRASELGEEGNDIVIDDRIIIEAAGETGLFYGAVSIMQILYQDATHTNIPKGYIRDYPEYSLRGGMIDVARKYFDIDYIEEIGKYMSWYKLNTLHLHLNEDSGDFTGAFVLESKLYPALNNGNGKYIWTQDEYRDMQKELKKFGVNVITEIDTPGHSRAFANVPGSPITGNGNNFPLADKYDQSINFVKSLFDEFLDGDDPVIQNAYIHMGTDEVGGVTKNMMRQYISDLSTYLLSKDNVEKVIFWANLSLYYGSTEINPENVATQIWDSADCRADEALSAGFDLINSTSNIFYLVPGYQTIFGEKGKFNGYIGLDKFYDTWEGSSDFTTHNQNNPDDWYGRGYYYAEHDFLLGDPKILGTLFCDWNDSALGHEYDLLELMISYMAGIAEKCWYGDTDRFESGEEFVEAFSKVGDSAPYANPRYRVESDGAIIASYDFEKTVNGAVKDSENGYNATIQNGAIETVGGSKVLALNGSTSLKMPFEGVGYPYTASFRIYLDGEQSEDAILFTCDSCTIYLNYNGEGVAFQSSFYVYGFGVSIPTDEWVDIKLTSQSPTIVDSQKNITILSINGKEYTPTCIENNNNGRNPSRATVLGTSDTFLGVKGYVDDLLITKTYQFDPVIDTFRFEGKGTEASPYLIQNATDLCMFSILVNRGEYLEDHFKLTADIDMSGIDFDGVYEFSGILDGDGHVIKNVVINTPGVERVGFIGYLKDGTVKNLGLAQAAVVGGNKTGALVGFSANATILNCFAIATVKGGNDTGVLIGRCDSSVVQNCFTAGSVSGGVSTGGIFGSENVISGVAVNFDNLYTIATVKGTQYVGAIVGWEDGGTMSNLYYTTGAVSGNRTRTATKMTAEKLTDGTLLAALNGKLADGYTAFVAGSAGYPVFEGTDPDFIDAELPKEPEEPQEPEYTDLPVDEDGHILENKEIDIIDGAKEITAGTANGYLEFTEGQYATYKIKGNYEGQYELIIHYADPAGWILKAEVNGVSHTQQIYGANDGNTVTPSWNPADGTKTHTFIVDLVNGENTITFRAPQWYMASIAKFELVRVA